MKKYIGISIMAVAMGLGLTSCDDFLDKLPDNRTEANTEEKIQKLLVAAYPTHDHMGFTEYASDNVDDMGESNPYTDRYLDQLYTWADVTETDNQDPESYWMDLYQCIYHHDLERDAGRGPDVPRLCSLHAGERLRHALRLQQPQCRGRVVCH